jgi:hypothetical protein
MSRLWHIQGYDSGTLIFDARISVGSLSESQLKALLMALTAKAGLNFNEIVGAYAKRGTKSANALLTVQKEGPSPVFMCGTNPHFVARTIDA